MIAVLGLLAAAVVLVVGWLRDNDALVVAACALAGVVVVAVGIDLVRERLTGPEAPPVVASPPVHDEPASDPVEESGQEPDVGAQAVVVSSSGEVVFVAGRTTFHRSDCSSVRGRQVSRGTRGDLEAGGMTACRTCLR